MAKKSAGSSKKPTSKASGKSGTNEVLELNTNRELLILQVPGAVGRDRLVALVQTLCQEVIDDLKPGQDWVCFVGTNQPHYAGLDLWLGLTDNAPPEVLEALSQNLEQRGVSTSIEMGIAANQELLPDFRVTADGWEALVPAALAGAPGRTVNRGGMELKVRGYVTVKGEYESESD